MGLPVGPDAFGLCRRRSSLPYFRYARSSLLGSLQNRLGQLYRLFCDGPLGLLKRLKSLAGIVGVGKFGIQLQGFCERCDRLLVLATLGLDHS